MPRRRRKRGLTRRTVRHTQSELWHQAGFIILLCLIALAIGAMALAH